MEQGSKQHNIAFPNNTQNKLLRIIIKLFN